MTTPSTALWLAGALWGTAYFLTPAGIASEAVWLTGITAALALAVRAVVGMGGPRTGWVAITAGLTCTVLGDYVFAYFAVIAETDPFPTVGDAFYLASYPLMAVGLARLARSGRGRNRPQPVIDGLILSGAAALAVWILFIAPVLGDASEPVLARAVAAAYPIGDLLLLVTCTQLLVHRLTPAPALWLIVLGTTSTLAADVWYLYLETYASYSIGHPVDALWGLGVLAVAAAVTHPSAPSIVGGTDDEAAADLRPSRLMVLAVAAIAAPTTNAVLFVLGDQRHDGPLLVGTLSLFALVIIRLWLVAHDLQTSRSELRHRATHDELTGLANRALFNELLYEEERQGRTDGAVLLVDVDAFKAVNDTFGHSTGDAILRAIGQRLRTSAPAAATVARIGGDEFAVLLMTADDLESVAAGLVEAARQPVDANGRVLRTSISCGGARLGDGQGLHLADDALYTAKRLGRDRYVISPGMPATTTSGGSTGTDAVPATATGT